MPNDNKKKNITGSYPGVTGTYKPRPKVEDSRSFVPPTEVKKPAAPKAVQKPRTERLKEQIQPQKEQGFDFKAWFSSDNMKAFLRQFRYYGAIVAASLVLTACIVSVANDVFAFIKPDNSVVVNIVQGGSTMKIAKELKKSGVIEYPFLFRVYSKLKHADGKFQYGDYSLNSNLGYDQIISALKKTSVQAQTVSFTIPEGCTQDDFVELMTSKKYLAATDLENALNSYDYEQFEFVSQIPERRCRLEGYLIAGDYEMSVGESAVSVVTKILQRFSDTVLTDENKALIKSSGLTLDNIITAASLVQSECDNPNDYKAVASVIFNRLNATTKTPLCLTSPINYVLSEPKIQLTADDKLTDSEYNTYIYSGLPKGPVCSPSQQAITSTLMRDSSAYMYFISDGEKTQFSTTASEHLQKLKKASASAKGTETIK